MTPVCIMPSQARLHRSTEAAAVLVVAPFLFYIATRKSLPNWARMVAAVFGVGTVLVDGYLLTKWS
jgi:predicted benzoate:H+ symporter BenE